MHTLDRPLVIAITIIAFAFAYATEVKATPELEEAAPWIVVSTEKYNDLKMQHETDVRELFENIGTLKFVKELRFFKKQWGE